MEKNEFLTRDMLGMSKWPGIEQDDIFRSAFVG